MSDPGSGVGAQATVPVRRDPLPGDLDDRLAAQLRFAVEVGRVTQVLRRNLTVDGSRRETTAEHQWHVALMALVLAEHAAEPVDPLRVVTMLLVHDVVEVDAGDAYLYDAAARAAAVDLEARAAARLFGLLPVDQAAGYLALWQELEAGATTDARFARSLDRLAPLLCNAASGGQAWRDHGVTADRAAEVAIAPMVPGSPVLADAARSVVAMAVEAGLLRASS